MRIKFFRPFRNVSISKKLYFTVGIMALLIIIELFMLSFSIDTLSSVRAYVGGEGLWSKAQKDAIYHLQKYGLTEDEKEYEKFIRFMEVPLGDSKALEEIKKEEMDLERAKQGFIEGKNHPDDVAGMIMLFRRFGFISYIKKAGEIWSEADPLAHELMKIGKRLNQEITAEVVDEELVHAILAEIDPINERLTVLEDEFSYTLGEGSRWLEGVVFSLLFGIAITVEATGLFLAITISRSLQSDVNSIIDSANAIGSGNFTKKAVVNSNDEIGILATSFNKMAMELKQSIDSIHMAQKRFKDLLESAPDAMVIMNQEGTIILVNEQVHQIFGFSQLELNGEKVQKLIPEIFSKNGGINMDAFFNMTGKNKFKSLELSGFHKNGNEFPVEINVSPIETGQEQLITAAIRDITDRKKAEQTLKKSLQALDNKNKELEQFAFVASHDLQEPLRTVGSFIDLLNQEYDETLDDTAKKYMRFITEANNRMSDLVKGLLDYSRIGKHTQREAIDSQKLVLEIQKDLETMIKETNSRIEYTRLPEIWGNKTELRVLFQNIIMNAIKFRKPDTPPHIKISAKKNHKDWVFSFQDNGIGIEDKFLDKIFIIFQRLHNRNQYEGTGIGLAHSRKITELHGGRLWVESIPGEGSTFFVLLPGSEF